MKKQFKSTIISLVGSNLVYGFLDESPSLHDEAFFFCIGILLTADSEEKHYRSIFKKIRTKILDRKLKKVSEIKFANSTDKVRKRVFTVMSKLPIKAVVLAVNTERRRISETPENYGIAVGFAVTLALKQYSPLVLTIDKKFTSKKDQTEVEEVALKVVAREATKGVFNFRAQEESHKNSLLQLVDFIAGAYNYKYNRQDDSYWKMIKHLVTEEKTASWPKLKAATKKE